MTLYFSPSVKAFYDSSIPAEIPADAVEISQAEHTSLLDAINGGGSFLMTDGRPVAMPRSVSLDELKAERLTEVEKRLAARMSTGYELPGDLHIAITDAVERRLTSMGTTAGFAVLGITTWPEEYQRGWITETNVRYPLPKPEDGVALATAVGAFSAALIQHGRDIKDAILAAKDAASLSAIDIEAGWPEGAAA
ncbi:hypothetical protein [Agrobacterium pusense]|uniref:DUF4376 domain-containing protein n=1 Tax=Agrobacterium pusense TaxID=648995 RepID=UPI0010AEE9AB|nr:hypothetical protein [Agrobacterium pusense]WCK24609.1 hypothetical protein CFBP5496_0003165 [Agrobacterium pusense]